MQTVTNEQWSIIEQKFGGLMRAAAMRVMGDNKARDIEDSLQETRMASMSATISYAKKNNLKFEDFIDTVDFSKYIKTSIWNKKSRVGMEITKKSNVRNTLSIEPDLTQDQQQFCTDLDPSSIVSAQSFNELDFDSDENIVLRMLETDSDCYTKGSGRINIAYLTQETGFTRIHVEKIISSLQKKLKDFDD
jgi:hypothetical protein